MYQCMGYASAWGAMDDQGMAVGTVLALLTGEIGDRTENVLLIGWVLVGVEVAGYAFNLRQPSRPAPLLAAETECGPTGRECVLSITHVLGENR